MPSNRFPSILTALAAVVLSGCSAGETDYASYVNTLQGTHSCIELSHGNSYPATVLPHGLHAWSPQTGYNGDGTKYQYQATEIRGFQQSHQCNSWMNDYAQFSFMPLCDTLIFDNKERGVGFSHSDETAKPFYYSVKLANDVKVEMAPATRGACLRFSYPETSEAYLVFDANEGDSHICIDPQSRTLTGWVRNYRYMGNPDTFRNYFRIVFDQPFVEYGIWEGVNGTSSNGCTEKEGDKVGAYFKFAPGTSVLIKAASSFISPEQAARNFDEEIGRDATLEQTRDRAHKVWNQTLSKIEIEGANEEDMTTFYSCLYHASLYPRMFYELKEDGSPYYYSPFDGQVHDGYMFTDNGLWDTFRSQFPLNCILDPENHEKYLSVFYDIYKQGGWLPAWCAPSEAGIMIGNHAISLLLDGWVKGLRSFDPAQVLEAYRHEVTAVGPFGGSNGRPEWEEFKTMGYVPYPDGQMSVAKTLEYSYDDFCAWKLARLTGQKEYEDYFRGSLENWKNVYDPQTGFMRGKCRDGNWYEPFNPLEWGGPYCEGNAWHYSWSVFHDIRGLIDIMGGDEKITEKMDSVFTLPNTVLPGTFGGLVHEMREMMESNMGQYAHNNQPIQHMPYIYTYAGHPEKTQYRVREIMRKLYSGTEKGFAGDEDQGAMSAWYIMSSLGFFSVCPGTDQYVFGSPQFSRITLNLENGRKFVIEAPGNSPENVYVQEVSLNGKKLDRNYITHAEIISGGKLEMVIGPTPAPSANSENMPYSFSTSE